MKTMLTCICTTDLVVYVYNMITQPQSMSESTNVEAVVTAGRRNMLTIPGNTIYDTTFQLET